MSGNELGIVPATKRIPLTNGADWRFTLLLSTNWPAGVTVSVVLANGLTWTATISGVTAKFSVDKAITNTVADGTRWKLMVTDGTIDECWLLGTIVRFDGAPQ